MAEITRENLELAALAYGIDESWTGNAAYMKGMLSTWRPRLDDGDAARLAVAVGIITQPQISVPVVNAWMTGWKYQGVREHVRHDGTEPDKLRAWREAVVLCAAAVGDRMKGGA